MRRGIADPNTSLQQDLYADWYFGFVEFVRMVQNALCLGYGRRRRVDEAALGVDLDLVGGVKGLDNGIEGDGDGGGEVERAF